MWHHTVEKKFMMKSYIKKVIKSVYTNAIWNADNLKGIFPQFNKLDINMLTMLYDLVRLKCHVEQMRKNDHLT